ncbi:MAG: hypothetical protein CVT77_09425 [Alphaproteobacteria bacterium HGW-Alphaproteobacteria-16]|nr:MAG: hypothetical protein CVT77_09425 [Alphaproteobacteria bacterium HGW-Alphaproteobacteria-16]
MLQRIKARFTKRRVALLIGLAAAMLWMGWRTGGFDTQPEQKPCVEGRQEIKDDAGKVVQVIRTTCYEDK